MRKTVMNTWAMNTKWWVIKGYLRNITSASTPEESSGPLSIRLEREARTERDRVWVQTIRRQTWVMAAPSISHWTEEKKKKNWHVIKSDPDIPETKSCPLPYTSVESRLVLKCKDIQTTTSKFKVVRLLRSSDSVIFESLQRGQEIFWCRKINWCNSSLWIDSCKQRDENRSQHDNWSQCFILSFGLCSTVFRISDTLATLDLRLYIGPQQCLTTYYPVLNISLQLCTPKTNTALQCKIPFFYTHHPLWPHRKVRTHTHTPELIEKSFLCKILMWGQATKVISS